MTWEFMQTWNNYEMGKHSISGPKPSELPFHLSRQFLRNLDGTSKAAEMQLIIDFSGVCC